MTGLYHYPPGWLHKMPAGIKLLALAVFSIICLNIESAAYLSLALAAAAVLYILAGVRVAGRLLLLKPLWPVIAAIFVTQYYIMGIDAAIASTARLVLMFFLADLVTMSTPMQAMMDAISTLLQPLRFIGLDSRKLAFCVALVIRFVPLLLDMWRQQTEAWRARTGRRASWRLIAPFLANVMRMADVTADALDARGFGKNGFRVDGLGMNRLGMNHPAQKMDRGR